MTTQSGEITKTTKHHLDQSVIGGPHDWNVEIPCRDRRLSGSRRRDAGHGATEASMSPATAAPSSRRCARRSSPRSRRSTTSRSSTSRATRPTRSPNCRRRSANQQIDVAIVDDGPMYQAINLGFCGEDRRACTSAISTGRRHARTTRRWRIGVVGTGLMYNTKIFQGQGLAPPTSWNDLKDPKYKKMLVIPPINNTYGLHTLVMFARMNGGGEKNIDPGFKVMKDAGQPERARLRAVARQDDRALPERPGGDRGVGHGSRASRSQDTGFPVEFVYPKEGAIALGISACPVAKPNASPLGAGVHRSSCCSRTLQVILAKGYGLRSGEQEDGAAARSCRDGRPYGDAVAKLINRLGHHQRAIARRGPTAGTAKSSASDAASPAVSRARWPGEGIRRPRDLAL